MTDASRETLSTPELLPQSECFVFLEKEPGFAPASAYREYCRRREETRLNHPLLYASTTITSGGYRRDDGMPIGEAIRANSHLARQIVDEGLLQHGIEPSLIVLPSELGKVPDWKQTDYLQFWMYIIRAVHPDSAHQLETEWFNNPSIELPAIGERMETAPTYESRRDAYIEFVRQFLSMLASPTTSELLAPNWQPPAVIPVFDNSMSLGCSAEYYFADTVLPKWQLMPRTRDLQQTVAHFIGKDAMVSGVTTEDVQASREASAKLWAEYYAAKD